MSEQITNHELLHEAARQMLELYEYVLEKTHNKKNVFRTDDAAAMNRISARLRGALALDTAKPTIGSHDEIGTNWEHIKTGGTYKIIGVCKLEHNNASAFLYRSDKDGVVWARELDEFLDGRFVMLEQAPAQKDNK